MTSTGPALRLTGALQVIVVLSTTLIGIAGFPLIVTEVAPVKFVPVIVIIVPPAVLPNDGERLVITAGVI